MANSHEQLNPDSHDSSPSDLTMHKQKNDWNNHFGLDYTAQFLALHLDELLKSAGTIADETQKEIVHLSVPIVGDVGVAETYAAAVEVLNNTTDFGRAEKISAIQRGLLGGKGPLTEAEYHVGAGAVTDAFGSKRLREEPVRLKLMEHINNVFNTMVTSTEPYDVISSKARYTFLANIFFGSSMSPKEMETVFTHVNGVFKKIPVEMMLQIDNPEKFGALLLGVRKTKEAGDAILNRLIDERVKNPSKDARSHDLLDFLIARIENKNDYEAWRGEIRSTVYQVVFAAKETTEAAIGFGWEYLTREEKAAYLEELRNAVIHYFDVTKKGDTRLYFAEIETEKPDKDIQKFIQFFGHILMKTPPTFINGRNTNVPYHVHDGVIPANATVFIDVSRVAQEQQKGEEFQNADELRKNMVFGDGIHFCKGNNLAIYEGVAHFMYALYRTKDVERKATGKVEFGSTQAIKGMKLKLTPRDSL